MPSATPLKLSEISVPEDLRIVALPTDVDLDQSPTLTKSSIVPEGDNYPCRRCLQDAEPGDKVILLPYDPFFGDSPYRQQGPIFVHESPDCSLYQHSGKLPDQLYRRNLTVRSFNAEHFMTGFEITPGKNAVNLISEVMKDKEVAYVHLHYAAPGCFAARIERAE